jgi:metal-responsive CopG/Arc/MetJ family transcriptional regulator
MRLHINLDGSLVEELDRRIGRRGRSAFVADAVRHALEDERRWEDIEAGLGTIADSGHEWDAAPTDWVRAQRRSDTARVG